MGTCWRLSNIAAVVYSLAFCSVEICSKTGIKDNKIVTKVILISSQISKKKTIKILEDLLIFLNFRKSPGLLGLFSTLEIWSFWKFVKISWNSENYSNFLKFSEVFLNFGKLYEILVNIFKVLGKLVSF